MRYQTPLRALLVFLLSIGLLNAALVDDIGTKEAEYTALNEDETELLELQGQDRKDETTDLTTSLNTLKTSVANLITANGGLAAIEAIDATYRTRLETLQTNIDNSLDHVSDFNLIGDVQEASISALIDLAQLTQKQSSGQTVSQLQAANTTAVTDSHTTIDAALTAANAVIAAGVGEDGGLETSASETEYNFEVARLQLVDQLADLCDTLPALNSTLINAVNNLPDPEDDTLAMYDTALLAAQDAIEAAASALSTAAAAAAAKAQEIIESDPDDDDDDIADRFPALGQTALNAIDTFTRFADKETTNSTLTRTEINLRTLQRQLLFDNLTVAQKQTIRASIKSIYTTQLGQSEALAEKLAEVAERKETPVIDFPEASLPEVAGKSGQEQLVDRQTKEEEDELRNSIETLNNNKPPAPELISAGTSRMRPILKLVSIAALMNNFLNSLVANSAIKRVSAAVDKDAELATLKTEWAEYLRLANLYLTDPEIDKTRTVSGSEINIRTNLETTINHAMITGLFTDLESEARKVRAFTRRVSKSRRRFRRFSVAVLSAERIILNEIAFELDRNGSIEPVATPTSVANSDTNTTIQDVDGGNQITGDLKTRDDLEDGSQYLITGEGAALDDPIIEATANKLTANIKIFLKESAHIGLGAANISTKSGGQSPNVLGGTDSTSTDVLTPNSVQLIADGNCFIKLHSDIYITGSKPFVPTAKFGQGAVHRMTFYSEKEVSLRVKKDVTLDLSAFANTQSGTERGTDASDTVAYTSFGKQIVFAGKVKLVLEPGAKIRFPKVTTGEQGKGVVLYFNDDSQLMFEGDLTNESRRFEGATLTGTDCIRNKLIGMGQIWLNKQAKMIIPENAYVGVESDYKTPLTDLTLSLQRDAEVRIGTTSTKGGAFQIGNIFDGGSSITPHDSGSDTNFPNTSNNSDGGFVPRKTFVNFKLILNGTGSKFTIGRNAFFGCSVGILNKSGRMNGVADDSYATAWQVQRCYNVGNIIFDIQKGIFEHNQVSDGADASENGSVMGIGTIRNFPGGKYIFKLGSRTEAFIRGGGNLLFLSKDASMAIDSEGALVAFPHTLSIGSSTSPLVVDALGTSNTGTYAVLAPSRMLRQQWDEQLDAENNYYTYGRAFTQTAGSTYAFAGPQEEFFKALSMPDIRTMSEKMVVVGHGGESSSYAFTYLVGTTVKRRSTNTIAAIDINPASLKPEDVIAASGPGYLIVDQISGSRPLTFRQPSGG